MLVVQSQAVWQEILGCRRPGVLSQSYREVRTTAPTLACWRVWRVHEEGLNIVSLIGDKEEDWATGDVADVDIP